MIQYKLRRNFLHAIYISKGKWLICPIAAAFFLKLNKKLFNLLWIVKGENFTPPTGNNKWNNIVRLLQFNII